MSDMPPPLIEAGLLKAKARAGTARGVLVRDLVAIKERLTPRALLRSIGHAAAEKSLEAIEAGVEQARSRPALATGVATLAALVFARKPIQRALSAENDATLAPSTRSGPKPVRKGKR